MGFREALQNVNDTVNTFVWTTVGVWLLMAVGLIMTVITKFFQVTHIRHWFKVPGTMYCPCRNCWCR